MRKVASVAVRRRITVLLLLSAGLSGVFAVYTSMPSVEGISRVSESPLSRVKVAVNEPFVFTWGALLYSYFTKWRLIFLDVVFSKGS